MGKFGRAKEKVNENRIDPFSGISDLKLIYSNVKPSKRAQFPKFQKLVCKTGNPLPNTLKSTHLSELLNYPVCKDETLYFSVFDQGLKKVGYKVYSEKLRSWVKQCLLIFSE